MRMPVSLIAVNCTHANCTNTHCNAAKRTPHWKHRGKRNNESTEMDFTVLVRRAHMLMNSKGIISRCLGLFFDQGLNNHRHDKNWYLLRRKYALARNLKQGVPSHFSLIRNCLNLKVQKMGDITHTKETTFCLANPIDCNFSHALWEIVAILVIKLSSF